MERPVVLPAQLPVLAINSQVLLPTAYLRLKVPAKAKKSVSVIEALYQSGSSADQYVAVFPSTASDVPQKTAHPSEDTNGHTSHLIRFGTAAKVLQISKLVQSDEWVLVVEGVARVSLVAVSPAAPPARHDLATIQQLELRPAQQAAWAVLKTDAEYQAAGKQLKASTRRLLQLLARQAGLTSKRVLELLDRVPHWRAADVVASALTTSFPDRLEALLAIDPKERVRLALQLVEAALKTLSAREGLPPGGRMPLGRLPRPGDILVGGMGRPAGRPGQDEDGEDDDVDALVARLKAAGMPPDTLKVALKEVRRLRHGEHHPGAQASRTYLELLADLPWARLSTSRAAAAPTQPAAPGAPPVAPPAPPPRIPPIDLQEARHILDRAHHGLDKVKERIIQYLAVLQLRGSHARAPILCFIGPPGVGKTSVARSVAEVLRRPLVRISLGGVRDEAEVRGHRRTYVGALPGRIIQGMKRAGVRDPVMLLDEIDKLGRDARGDPAAALLEVLDPEQHAAFVDAYLGVPFDLSAATFLATANKPSDIPAPLLDRLEVIQLAGYTLEEKVRIAADHLLPQQLADHGLPPAQVAFPPSALAYLVEHYTREAGVRSLSRGLAALCRHVAVQVVGHRAAHPPPREAAEAESYEREAHHPASSAAHPHPAAPSSTAPRPRQPTPSTSAAHHAASAAPHHSPSYAVAPPHDPHLPHHPRTTLYGSGDIHLDSHADAAKPPTTTPATTTTTTTRLTPTHPPPYLPPPPPTATGLPYTPDLLHPPATLHPPIVITPEFIRAVLGPEKYAGTEASQRITSPGAAAGLVWTAAGGMVQYIECCAVGPGQPGRSGHLTLTGQVGEVLEESAQIAMSWIRAHAHELGLEPPTPAPAPPALWHAALDPAGAPFAPPTRRRAPLARNPLEDDTRAPESGGRRHLALLAMPAAHDASDAAAAGRDCCSSGGCCSSGSGAGGCSSTACYGISRSCTHAVGSSSSGGGGGGSSDSGGSQCTHASTGIDGAVSSSSSSGSRPTDSTAAGPGEAGPRRSAVEGSLAHPLTARLHQIIADDAEDLAAPPAASTPRGGCPLEWDVHVHLPAGAIPKDGPSAGITLAVALLSLLSGRTARADTAMTGELTLRGLVLPVGGIKEKLLAAQHSGLQRVLVPAGNAHEVAVELPASARSALQVVPVARLDDVLLHAFDPPYRLLPPRPRL